MAALQKENEELQASLDAAKEQIMHGGGRAFGGFTEVLGATRSFIVIAHVIYYLRMESWRYHPLSYRTPVRI